MAIPVEIINGGIGACESINCTYLNKADTGPFPYYALAIPLILILSIYLLSRGLRENAIFKN